MQAYISIKYHPDNKNRERIEKISAALAQCGFETVCVVRDVEKWGQVTFDPRELMQKTFDEIDASHVVVLDLTEKGVGVGIEAGYAHARGLPIVTIASKGSDISTTLRGISHRVFLYGAYDELVSFFTSGGAAPNKPATSLRRERLRQSSVEPSVERSVESFGSPQLVEA